ncbi:MAG: hypothetical protein ACJAZX_001612 [Rickettsiales bacterium]|jgi:hypothetical protein
MSILAAIGIISDIISISSGNIPFDSAIRMGGSKVPALLFRKKGMSRAQVKKKTMAKRRRFVDNVVMIHERRIQKFNFDKTIEDAKKELDKKKIEKPIAKKPTSRLSLDGTRNYRNSYNDNEDINEDANEKNQAHLSIAQSIIAQKKSDQGIDWVDKGSGNKKNGSGKEV